VGKSVKKEGIKKGEMKSEKEQRKAEFGKNEEKPKRKEGIKKGEMKKRMNKKKRNEKKLKPKVQINQIIEWMKERAL
jgi:hypothetical protein